MHSNAKARMQKLSELRRNVASTGAALDEAKLAARIADTTEEYRSAMRNVKKAESAYNAAWDAHREFFSTYSRPLADY